MYVIGYNHHIIEVTYTQHLPAYLEESKRPGDIVSIASSSNVLLLCSSRICFIFSTEKIS